MEVDTTNQTTVKRSSSAVRKVSQVLDFPAMCWIWQEAHFPFMCLNLAISAAHYRCNYWNTQYLHNTALKLPSVWGEQGQVQHWMLNSDWEIRWEKKKREGIHSSGFLPNHLLWLHHLCLLSKGPLISAPSQSLQRETWIIFYFIDNIKILC